MINIIQQWKGHCPCKMNKVRGWLREKCLQLNYMKSRYVLNNWEISFRTKKILLNWFKSELAIVLLSSLNSSDKKAKFKKLWGWNTKATETLKIWLEKMWKTVGKTCSDDHGSDCVFEPLSSVLFILCSGYSLIWDLEFNFLLCQLFPIFSFGFHFLFSFDSFLSLLGLALVPLVVFDCCHLCLVTLLCLNLASLFLFVTG